MNRPLGRLTTDALAEMKADALRARNDGEDDDAANDVLIAIADEQARRREAEARCFEGLYPGIVVVAVESPGDTQ
jgi:hypothetical protein